MAGGFGIQSIGGVPKDYPGKVTAYVLITCIAAAMGGSDIRFDSFTLTMFTSSLYLAALVTLFSASKVTRSLGRSWSMVLGGTIFLCGAIVNAAAQNIAMLIVGRILLDGFAT
ncbi:hypothetical protein NL676_002013 [Syzygium grande]|nr:hypothetical protein NL676_002013 [Syzygium grande]